MGDTHLHTREIVYLTRCWLSTMSRPWKGQLSQFRVHHTHWPGPGTNHFSPSCGSECSTAYITTLFSHYNFNLENGGSNSFETSVAHPTSKPFKTLQIGSTSNYQYIGKASISHRILPKSEENVENRTNFIHAPKYSI